MSEQRLWRAHHLRSANKIMKALLLLGIAVILSGCATNQYSNVKPKTEDVWTEITYGTHPEDCDWVIAKIEMETFNKITSGRVIQGWLELENCYWSEEGQFNPVIESGKEWGYSGNQIIRIEDISRAS